MIPKNVKFDDFKYQYPTDEEFDEFSMKITRLLALFARDEDISAKNIILN